MTMETIIKDRTWAQDNMSYAGIALYCLFFFSIRSFQLASEQIEQIPLPIPVAVLFTAGVFFALISAIRWVMGKIEEKKMIDFGHIGSILFFFAASFVVGLVFTQNPLIALKVSFVCCLYALSPSWLTRITRGIKNVVLSYRRT